MQNTGNFNHFYIARFEALRFEIRYIKMPSYENIAKQTIKVCKYLKYEKLKRKHIILGKDINILIFYRNKLIL